MAENYCQESLCTIKLVPELQCSPSNHVVVVVVVVCSNACIEELM